MNQSINNEKQLLNSLEKRSREMQIKLEVLTNIEGELTKTIQIVAQLDELLRRRNELESKLESNKEIFNQKQSNIQELEINLQQQIRQVQILQQKLSNIRTSQFEKRNQFEANLNNLRDCYTQLIEERSSVNKDVEKTELSIKQIEEKVLYYYQAF